MFPGSSPAQDDEEPEDPVDKPDDTSGEVRVGNEDGEEKQVFLPVYEFICMLY